MRIPALILAAALAAATPLAGAPADPGPRTVTIAAGDDMKFSVTEVTARRGERLRLVLRGTGTMPKIAMAHNVVVLAKGTDVNAIVSPRDGYPTDGDVDREYAVVQSEFYLKPGDGDLHLLDFDAAARKAPSHVLFNGHLTALTDRPLQANAGDRVRLYVHNAGPNDQSSTHIIGTIVDRVFYEGNPRNDWRGMQTVVLGASSGAVLEFIAPEEGDYVIVDHEFADAQKGAIGHIAVKSRTGATTRRITTMSH